MAKCTNQAFQFRGSNRKRLHFPSREYEGNGPTVSFDDGCDRRVGQQTLLAASRGMQDIYIIL